MPTMVAVSAVAVVVVTAFASLAGAVPRAPVAVVHERRSFSPEVRGWRLARRLEPERILPLRIGLAHSNVHTLEEALTAVSHPDSPDYGKHWSPERIVEHFAPAKETVESVIEWLLDEGFERERVRLTKSKSWLEVNATVEEAERLLRTEYHVFEDSNGAERVGCEAYHVPEHLTAHVDLIKPTTAFNALFPPASEGLAKREATVNPPIRLGSPGNGNGPKTNGAKVDGSTPLGLANCSTAITPICLQTLYNFANYTPVSTDKNTFGVVEFTPQAFLQSDLDLFFTNFSATQVGQQPQLVSIDGGVAQTTNQSFDFNGESDLDLEFAMSLTNPQPILLLQTGDLVEGAGFDNWLDAVDASFCTFEGARLMAQL